MPEYQCLRDCFVGGIFYVIGAIYQLSEGTHISPKNFRRTDGVPIEDPDKDADMKFTIKGVENGKHYEEVFSLI